MAKPKTIQTPWYEKTVKALQLDGMRAEALRKATLGLHEN